MRTAVRALAVPLDPSCVTAKACVKMLHVAIPGMLRKMAWAHVARIWECQLKNEKRKIVDGVEDRQRGLDRLFFFPSLIEVRQVRLETREQHLLVYSCLQRIKETQRETQS